MKRIRYMKDDNELLSKQSFQTNEGVFRVFIDSDTLSFDLINPDTGLRHFVSSGKAKTLSEVKKLAKAKLVSLGVSFDAETRFHHETIDIELPEELHYTQS